jgi:hypothetical protein
MLQKAMEDFVIDAQVLSVAIIDKGKVIRVKAGCICGVN